MVGTLALIVRHGRRIVKVDFIVCERIAAPVILECDFCDRFVEAIRPRKELVEMDDGMEVTIVRGPLRRKPKSPPLSQSQEYPFTKGRSPTKVKTAETIKLPPSSETWVTVTSTRHGLILLQPQESLYENHQVLTSNGVADVEPGRPFRVWVANFSEHELVLRKNQVVATALPHPTAVMPNPVSVAEVLGITNPEDAKDLEPKMDTDLHKESLSKFEVEDLDLSHVDDRYRTRFNKLLRKYETMWDGSLREIAATEHRIGLVSDALPIASRPYRAGPKAREAEQTEVNRMLESGVIEPAQSAWASPMVLVPKPDGSLRFCVDYLRLNPVTIRDSYPLPLMDECIDSLGDATLFITLDCNSGYWQITVSKKDQDKTSFVCHAGMYRYKRILFGLTNAPATFQRIRDILLGPYKWKSCLVYLDDVIIFSRDAESHFRHVEQVLNVLKDAGVSLKLKKCSFFADRVKYLGHVIRPGSLEIDETVTAASRQAKQPRTQKEVRSFLGLCNIYRMFVPNFTDTEAPLNPLLRKG